MALDKETKCRLAVMQHAKDGKIVECCLRNSHIPTSWIRCADPQWKWETFDYRIREGQVVRSKYLAFGTHPTRILSDVSGAFSRVQSHMFNGIDPEFSVRAVIHVEVDEYTGRIVKVSFENKE